MGGPFDFVGLIDEAKKNVDQAIDDVQKNANSIAQGVGETVGAAAHVVADTVDNAIEAVKESGRPKPQYCNDTVYLDAASYIAIRAIVVNRIRTNADGKTVEGYDQVLRMSTAGIELLANSVAQKEDAKWRFFKHKQSRDGISELTTSSVEVVANIRVRNCSMFKKGSTGGSNPLERAVGGAVAGGSIVGALNVLTVPVGAIGGALVGLMSPSGAEDVWFLDMLDYGGSEWVFKLGSKDDGEKIVEFLDAYFHF